MISETTECQRLDIVVGQARRAHAAPRRRRLAQRMMDIASQVRAMENVPLRLDSPEVRLGFHKLRGNATMPSDQRRRRQQMSCSTFGLRSSNSHPASVP